MRVNQMFCLGYGYTARALASSLGARTWRIKGATRSPEKAAALNASGIEPILLSSAPLKGADLDGVNALLVSAPPEAAGCPALALAAPALANLAAKQRAPSWIGYLSSSGVYGDHGGAWVDEESAARPSSGRGKRRLEAERAWRRFCASHNLPLVIFRLPGIYGPGRSAIDRVRRGTAQRIAKTGHVFNRMHVDDIAAALSASIARPQAGELFALADNEPAPAADVTAYACQLLGVAPPPLISFEDANLSDMTKSFYTDNKRVSNKRMKEKLNVSLRYPTYREGLQSIAAAIIK